METLELLVAGILAGFGGSGLIVNHSIRPMSFSTFLHIAAIIVAVIILSN